MSSENRVLVATQVASSGYRHRVLYTQLGRVAWLSYQVHNSLLLGNILSSTRFNELKGVCPSFLSDLPVWRALTCLACGVQVHFVGTLQAASGMNKLSCAVLALALVCAAQAISDAGKRRLLGPTLASVCTVQLGTYH